MGAHRWSTLVTLKHFRHLLCEERYRFCRFKRALQKGLLGILVHIREQAKFRPVDAQSGKPYSAF
jgi:hypothetical protein